MYFSVHTQLSGYCIHPNFWPLLIRLSFQYHKFLPINPTRIQVTFPNTRIPSISFIPVTSFQFQRCFYSISFSQLLILSQPSRLAYCIYLYFSIYIYPFTSPIYSQLHFTQMLFNCILLFYYFTHLKYSFFFSIKSLNFCNLNTYLPLKNVIICNIKLHPEIFPIKMYLFAVLNSM